MQSSNLFEKKYILLSMVLLAFCLLIENCYAERNVGISSTDGTNGGQMTIYNDPGKDSQGRDKGFSPRDLFGPTKSPKPAQKSETSGQHIEFVGEGEGLEGVSMENLRFIPDDAPAKTNSKKTNVPVKRKVSHPKPVSRTVKLPTNPKKPVQKKKQMTEDEFRKSIGMEPRTETEKMVETAAKGLLILGTLGLLGYALAPAKVAVAAKAGLAAKTAASGVAEAGGSQSFVAENDAFTVDEGNYTEEQVELPPQPKVGETRSYTDKNGTRWTEVFNGQNWVDTASNDAAVRQVADNQAWQEEQRIKQLNHDTAFDRELEQKRLEHQSQLEEIHARNRAEIRANAKIVLESEQMLQEMAERSLERVERVNQILDSGKTLAEVSLPIVGAFAGPPGWTVGTGYTLLSGAADGAGSALADSSKSLVVETARGLGKGVVNVVVAEGLNSAMAIGSKVVRAGLNTIPTSNSFKVSFSQTEFKAPIPTEEVGKMFRNLASGKNLGLGVNSEMAFSSLKEVGKSFMGGGKGVLSEAGSKIAQNSALKLGEGGIASARANIIDTNVGKFVNDNLWGKG